MRERTTWNRDEIQARIAAQGGASQDAAPTTAADDTTASADKTADPYLMNQDHVNQQPAADKYVNGDPSSWAEDVTPDNRWETEYAGGETKRNEIGMPEMRPETFNHPEKTAQEHALAVKKANLTIQVARLMLGSTVTDANLEEQALSLMHIPDLDLFETYTRLAKGQVPPEFLEHQKGKEDDKDDKKDDDKKEASAVEAKKSEDDQGDQDQGDQDQGNQDQDAQDDDADGKQATKTATVTAEQVQEMIQQAVAQQVQQQQQVQQAQQDQVQQAQQDQVQSGLTAEQVQQMIQQAFAAPACDNMGPEAQMEDVQFDAPPPGEMGIEMDSPAMDLDDEVQLGPEDAVLRQLFATNDSEAQAQIAGMGDPAPVTASVPQTRTASTKTVGTRPNGGVSRIGGGASPEPAGDNLSGMWESAPDVSTVFGVPGTHHGS